jgi:CelD/BcsL family acetyltransferase involved in cellulose biosynthesis
MTNYGSFRFSVLRSQDAFVALESDWKDLESRSGANDPFLSYDWLFTWYTHFGDPKEDLRVYCVFERDKLLGLAPCRMELDGPIASMTGLFNGYTGRSGLLLDASRPDAAAALLHRIFQDQKAFDVLRFSNIPEDALLLDLVRDRNMPSGVQALVKRGSLMPYILLEGDLGGFYQSRFSSERRQQDRRKLRKLTALDPKFEMRHLVDSNEIRKHLGAALQVEAVGWKGTERSAIIQSPPAKAFVSAIAGSESFPFRPHLFVLNAHDSVAAFILGFTFRDTFFYYKTSYLPSLKHVSPGRILLLYSLEWAFGQKLARYDFLGDADPFKMEFARLVRPHCHLFLYPRTVKSQCLRQWKRRALPRIKHLLGRPESHPLLWAS